MSRAQMNQKIFRVRLLIAIVRMLMESFCMHGRSFDLRMCRLNLGHMMTASPLLGTRTPTPVAGFTGATKKSGEEIGTSGEKRPGYSLASTCYFLTTPRGPSL